MKYKPLNLGIYLFIISYIPTNLYRRINFGVLYLLPDKSLLFESFSKKQSEEIVENLEMSIRRGALQDMFDFSSRIPSVSSGSLTIINIRSAKTGFLKLNQYFIEMPYLWK